MVDIQMKLHLDQHPKLLSGDETEETLEMKLWTQLAEAGVLFGPGWIFAADTEVESTTGAGHFRISFSATTVSRCTLSPTRLVC
jgi:aromatic amino acid aminotransferase I / 2-aminoadipate transaminase